MFLQCLAGWLYGAWGRSIYVDLQSCIILIWIKVCLAYAVVRAIATNRCFCGSYVGWQSGTCINDTSCFSGLSFFNLMQSHIVNV